MSNKQWGHGYHQGKKEQSLVGRFFHTFVDGNLHFQGHVIEKLNNDKYLVELFSFIDGSPTDQIIKSLDEMVDWKFYSSAKEMRFAYYKQERYSSDEIEYAEEIVRLLDGI